MIRSYSEKGLAMRRCVGFIEGDIYTNKQSFQRNRTLLRKRFFLCLTIWEVCDFGVGVLVQKFTPSVSLERWPLS